jgi:membrane associated rhomboid family serine protease
MNIFQDLKIQYKTGGIVQRIIFWNIGVFIFLSLVDVFFKISKVNFNYYTYVALSSDVKVFIFHFWTIFTYMFVHGGFFHLLGNIFVLWFSSYYFLTFFTTKQYAFVYFFGGIFAGLFFILFNLISGETSMLVGASAAIFSVLFAVTIYAPYTEVKLFFIGIVKLWHIAFFILFLDLIQMPFSNFSGHLSHFSGALFGFIFIKLLQNGTDISKPFSNLSFKRSTKKKTPFSKVHVNKNNKSSSNLKTKATDIEQKRVDDILDKISKSGYDSLTTEEKEFLFKLGK